MTNNSVLNKTYAKIKFVIRWHGLDVFPPCICPDCKCPECKCPLGVCFCSSMKPYDGPLTNQEIADDMGIANINIINDTLFYMKFFQETSLVDSTIVVDYDTYLPADVSKLLNKTSIEVLTGTYQVDFSNFNYGEVYINCISY